MISSKRNIEISNQNLIDWDTRAGFQTHPRYRCVSNEGEVLFDNYIKIDNADLLPDITAKIIKERFLL